jgi:hypothetical protein
MAVEMKNNLSTRDKAILIGLFLSRFDEMALTEFDFDSFLQAFNTLGFSIGVKPASIKNYRDEFDPYFPNNRKGWHKRPLREYCKVFYNEYSKMNFPEFSALIKSVIVQNYEIEKVMEQIEKKDLTESIAKRLITGKAAEEYFKTVYATIVEFTDYSLFDATNLACGFDYKLLCDPQFFCVEVKGLNLNTGSILLTEKEYRIANELKEKYCLFIVKNFAETPNHQYIFNPLHSGLVFKRMERKTVQISFSTAI